MKTLALPIILLIASAIQIDAEESALSVSVSMPLASTGEYILDQRQTPHFHVILSNRSDTPQKIWAPWSEFGERILRFEFTDKTNRFTVKRKIKERVSHELPEVYVLQPHENLVLDIHFADTNSWQSFPQAAPGFPPYTVRVVLEIPPNQSSESNRTWTGKIVSEEKKIVVYPWEPNKQTD